MYLFIAESFSIGTNFKVPWYKILLGDGSFIVCGREKERCVMARYSLQLGAQLNSVVLKNETSGMTDVELNGRTCVVLSYWYVCVTSD